MKKSFWVLLVLSLVFWLLDTKGTFGWLHQSFGNITNKGRREALEVIQKEDGKEESVSWETKIVALELRLKQLEEENKSARRLLGADLSPKLKFLPAHILGLNKDSFVLDQGSFAGILEDSLILSENLLVGKVVKVNSFNSQAISLSNSSFRLAVGIWGGEEEGKELKGKGLLQGGANLVVGEILPEEEVEEGDLVASLDQGGEFLIGKVTKVDWDQNKLFKNASVQEYINLRSLRTVLVVKQ